MADSSEKTAEPESTPSSVNEWTEEQLESWVLERGQPGIDWHPRQVLTYLRKVLNFSDDALLGYEILEDFLKDFAVYTAEQAKGITSLLLRKAWPEIEKLKKANAKKRKISHVEGEQDEHKAKKQKIEEEALEARDLFKVTADSIPKWTTDDKETLVCRLQQIIKLNDLKAQQTIYGTALQNTFPIVPCNQHRTVFQWFLFNVLPDDLKKFEHQLFNKPARNIQDPNCYLVYQVSGAGKTKLAYELSMHHYTIVVRCIEDPVLSQLKVIFEQNKIRNFNRLDFENRQKLPYYSLYIAYAWLRAHLKFLEFYQKEIVTQFASELTDAEKQMYFHLIQVNGSLSSKFLIDQFLSSIHFVTHKEDSRTPIQDSFETLQKEIDDLMKQTDVKAIAFDELLATRDVGVAMFAHNEMLADNATPEEIAAMQQFEMNTYFNEAILKPLPNDLPNNYKLGKFTHPTSLVNGVMHFIAKFAAFSAFIITDTSKSVQDYFMKHTGSRSTARIEEFIPTAYLGPKDLYNLLAYYFRVPNTPKLMNALKPFQGRALFFVYHFFFRRLLPAVEKQKPTSSDEVVQIIFDILQEGEAHHKCLNDADALVKEFFRKLDKSRRSEEVIQAIQVSVSLCAGSLNVRHLEVANQVNQLLAFVFTTGKECFIREPFILEALWQRYMSIGVDPNDDPIFKLYVEQFNKLAGPKEGRTIGKGEVLEVLVARCLQRLQGASFDDAFEEAIDLSGILPEHRTHTLSINCRIAGTITQFQLHQPGLQEHDLPDWSTSNAFLFPSQLMKPDGITFLINNEAEEDEETSKVLCLLQMRCYDKALSPGEVIDAAKTLDPNNFYDKSEQPDIKLRTHWLNQLKSDKSVCSLFKRYVRVIVNTAGFSEESVALVRAYNKLDTSVNTPIVLYVPTVKHFGTNLFQALGLSAQHNNIGSKTIQQDDQRLKDLSVMLPEVEPAAGMAPVMLPNPQRKIKDYFNQKVVALTQ